MFVNRSEQMSNLQRGHSIDASYQASVHLAKRFQRKGFKKIGQSETRIACGGHVW
jgi:3-methyladenine DNA glycosylase Tag